MTLPVLVVDLLVIIVQFNLTGLTFAGYSLKAKRVSEADIAQSFQSGAQSAVTGAVSQVQNAVSALGTAIPNSIEALIPQNLSLDTKEFCVRLTHNVNMGAYIASRCRRMRRRSDGRSVGSQDHVTLPGGSGVYLQVGVTASQGSHHHLGRERTSHNYKKIVYFLVDRIITLVSSYSELQLVLSFN